MLKIIDTYSRIAHLFEDSQFVPERWKKYINSIYQNSAHFFIDDAQQMCIGGYTFEDSLLPVINAVYGNPKLDVLHESFIKATDELNERIAERFGRQIDADIVLYLGLCNGAGWVTEIGGRRTVLLGVEKILELNWHELDSMYGLIYHELGHLYQAQYGVGKQHPVDHAQAFVWQLSAEGIAMCFEQELMGDCDYFHQDKDGWKEWCAANFARILDEFDRDLLTMTQQTQRYFGDWCDYHGRGDVGYYLGARFVRFMLGRYRFDEVICFDLAKVYGLYTEFVRKIKADGSI